MAGIWLIFLIVYGAAEGYVGISVLDWLLLIPLAAGDFRNHVAGRQLKSVISKLVLGMALSELVRDIDKHEKGKTAIDSN